MKKQLNSLKGKKLKSTDLISVKGGKKLNSSLEPVNTMVLTPAGGGHVNDDGNTDDSDWSSGSDL